MLPQMPYVAGVAHRYIDVRGVRVHLAEAGDGEAVVLQHGWPQHWYAWRHVIPALAARYRVICPDMRGHGWSDAPAVGYEMETLALDLVGVLDALSLERVKLIGHDWGAFAGFLACVHHPRRFERFVALGTSHLWPRPSVRAAAGLWRLAYQAALSAPLVGSLFLRNVPAVIRRGVRGAAVRKDALPADELEIYTAVLRDRDHARATVALYRTFLLREVAPLAAGRYRHHRLRVPTRLLVGEGDPVVRPALLRGFEPYADDMSVELVEGAGHWLPEEVPELVTERALEFFA